MRDFFNLRSKRGFTLTELIIVIAILAILAAILVPLMVGYISDAKEAVANANARSLYSAAAAAATMSIANGETVANIAQDSSGAFHDRVVGLLGDNFTGEWTVEANSDGSIVRVTWQEGENTVEGRYPVATATATPV
jgi:prepilin-type N-terminal cleavage/methylation domain-containing protein